jgi:probable blue pigment (indigoidine) exporter
LGALLTIVIGSTLVQSLSVHIHWWVVLTWQLIIGGSILLLAAFIDGSLLNPEQYQVVFEPISALQYFALFWLIVPNTAIAYTLYVWLLGRMSVAEFSFGTIANPIAGIVCAVLLINEQYQDWQYLLMFMMIVFSVLPQMLKLKQFKQQKT